MSICAASVSTLHRPAPSSSLQQTEPTPLKGQALSLVEQLRRTFRKRGDRSFGEFDASAQDFANMLRDYREQRTSWETLARFFGKRMGQILDGDDTPMHGQWLMVHWDQSEGESIDLFWLPFAEALTVRSDGLVESVSFLQTDKLSLAVRIDLSSFADKHPERQICLVKSTGVSALRTALVTALGIRFACDTKEETAALLEVIDAFVQEVPEEQRTPAHDQILQYCVDKDKQGYPVEIEELSEQLSNLSPTAFSAYISRCAPELPERVYTHRGSLKRYLRFWGRDNDLSISFAARRFGHGVSYDAVRDVLEISSLPRTLKQQLHQHLHDRSRLSDDNANTDKPLTDR